jgi:hypothetical protein
MVVSRDRENALAERGRPSVSGDPLARHLHPVRLNRCELYRPVQAHHAGRFDERRDDWARAGVVATDGSATAAATPPLSRAAHRPPT